MSKQTKRVLQSNQVLTRHTTHMMMPVVQHFGRKQALIAGGYATEKMLTLDPVDNGFGITSDEYGCHCTIWENYDKLDGFEYDPEALYFVEKYVIPGPEYEDKRAGQTDVRGLLEGFSK